MPLKVTRHDLVKGIPVSLEAEISSITPMGNTEVVLLELSWDGQDLLVPMEKSILASILTRPGIVEALPNQEPPKTSSRREGKSKIGPPVGTEKTFNGVKKRLVRYDFDTPRLKGKRRVTCPETGRKGFPIWERSV